MSITTKKCINRIEYRNSEDQLHREDGPAIIFDNGSKHWYINGNPHRSDGPAIINYSNSTGQVMYEWWVNGRLHRVDGPAIIEDDGTVEYWINGTRSSEEEFNNQRFIEWVKTERK